MNIWSYQYMTSDLDIMSIPKITIVIDKCIISYFNMTPVDFFAPLGTEDTPYNAICERLRSLDNADLEKVSTLLDWIAEQKNKA